AFSLVGCKSKGYPDDDEIAVPADDVQENTEVSYVPSEDDTQTKDEVSDEKPNVPSEDDKQQSQTDTDVSDVPSADDTQTKDEVSDVPPVDNTQLSVADYEKSYKDLGVPTVTIVSDAYKIAPYIELYHGNDGKLYTRFEKRLDELKDQIPVITYQKGMYLDFSDRFECWGVSAYDISGEHSDTSVSDLSALSGFNAGEYYFTAYIVEKHPFESEKYNGYYCVFRMTIPAIDPLVTVISDGEEIGIPKYWRWSESWSESFSGWLSSDGWGIYKNLQKNLVKAPEVRMAKDITMRYAENVSDHGGFTIYNENFEEINRLNTLEELKALGSGTYYVVTDVIKYGTEIHDGKVGASGYDCTFKLIVA
ncbi:MAG: hypothetical protein IKU61_04390, partial [Clostridia bacterium]|nr:hypothetical protein [Clostridia bacterium]